MQNDARVQWIGSRNERLGWSRRHACNTRFWDGEPTPVQATRALPAQMLHKSGGTNKQAVNTQIVKHHRDQAVKRELTLPRRRYRPASG